MIFYSRDQKFEPIPVSSNITAAELIGHHDISVLLDISGITNRGLFLKSDEEEQLFNSSECPCEVMFGVDDNGRIVRQPVGECVCVGGGRREEECVHVNDSYGMWEERGGAVNVRVKCYRTATCVCVCV